MWQRTVTYEDGIVKYEKKVKGTIECDKRTVICEVGTAQCEDETVKYKKKIIKRTNECDKRTITCDIGIAQCEIGLHNVRMEPSNIRKK